MQREPFLIFNFAVHGFRFCQTRLTVATKPLEVFHINNCLVRKKPRTGHSATLTRANKLVHACFARENVERASGALIPTGAV